MKIRFPKVYFVDGLPQWILSSDDAAYNPNTNSIWVKNYNSKPDLYSKLICKFYTYKSLLHELGHWVGFVLRGKDSRIHKWLDGGEPNFH